MGRKRKKQKSDNEDRTLKYIIFITATLNLIKALIELINKLIE